MPREASYLRAIFFQVRNMTAELASWLLCCWILQVLVDEKEKENGNGGNMDTFPVIYGRRVICIENPNNQKMIRIKKKEIFVMYKANM